MAHPGVDKTQDPLERRYHKYYQWVCFCLFFQVLLPQQVSFHNPITVPTLVKRSGNVNWLQVKETNKWTPAFLSRRLSLYIEKMCFQISARVRITGSHLFQDNIVCFNPTPISYAASSSHISLDIQHLKQAT